MTWAAHEKPAIFFSIVIGAIGPVMLVSAPSVKRAFGVVPRAQIPMTYPSELKSTRPSTWTSADEIIQSRQVRGRSRQDTMIKKREEGRF